MGLLNHQSAVRAVDTNGVPISGARLHIYLSGTDSLVRIYEDQHLTYTQENPMKADVDGYFAQCFLPGGDYRICLENRFGTTFLSDAEITVAAETFTTTVSETAGFQQELDGKADADHAHSAADVTGLQDMIDMAVSTAAGPVVYRGGWDASSGAFPSNASSGDTFSVTVAGVVEGISYAPGDQIIANTSNAATVGEWDRIRPAVSLGEFDTVEDLLATSQGMAIGKTVLVAGGQFKYQVADPAATDYHLTTLGGVRLYAHPDHKGAVSAKQIGIADSSDGTAEFARFCASRLDGITRFVCDVDFNLASPSHTGFTAAAVITLEADNVDQIGHGKEATRTISMLNLIQQRATANSLNRYTCMFDAKMFRARGLRFAYDIDVTEAEIIGNGNGNAVFYDKSGTGSGFFAEKCKTDFLSGFLLRIIDHPYWRVSDCWAGKQFYFVYLNGRCDYGLFSGNSGDMGYVDSIGTNNFGDYIKAGASLNGFGSRYCTVTSNHFVNSKRDAVDSTGGLHGWKISNNIFDVTTAAIDAKQQVNDASVVGNLEGNFKGLTISNNIIRGGEFIFTLNEDLTSYGLTAPEWLQVNGIISNGNVFIPRPGRENCGYYFKGVHDVAVTGDNFTSYRLRKEANFDPAGAGVFPQDAIEGTYYEATSTATIDGLAISVGDFVVPKFDHASMTSSTEWVIKNTAWLSCSMFRTDNGTSNGYTNQGSWDASTGTFPVSTSDGQYWIVSVAGTLDGMRFEVGNFLVALVNSASTTVYDGNWIKRRGTYSPPPAKNISFKNIVWDARGTAACTLDECENVSLHFASLITDHSETFDIRSTAYEIDLSGRFEVYPDEFNPSSNVEPISIQSSADIRIDFDATHHGSQGRGDFIRHFSGRSPRIWLDGTYRNFRAPIRAQDTWQVLNLGMGRGFFTSDCDHVLVKDADINPVRKGLMENIRLTNSLSSNDIGLTGNLYGLDPGDGLKLTIAMGIITATHTAHAINTEADGLTDDLATIYGGMTGDLLTIYLADGARTVAAKNGIGNLRLGGDRSLNETGDTLVLRKHADGGWHEVAFSSVT